MGGGAFFKAHPITKIKKMAFTGQSMFTNVRFSRHSFNLFLIAEYSSFNGDMMRMGKRYMDDDVRFGKRG